MSDQNGTVRIVDVGRAIPIVKGVWDAETAYEMLDIVSYEDYTYIAKANTEPGISPANMEYWLVLAGSVTSWGAIRGLLENQTDLQAALDAKLNAGDAGSMAAVDDVQHDGLPYLRKDGEWINSDSRYYTESEADTLLAAKANAADLGALADHDTVDYRTEVTHKPTLGALADHDKVNYDTEITNLPTLGTMAAKDDAASDNKAYGRRNAAWYDLDGRYYTESEVNTKLVEKAKNTLIAETFATSVSYNKGDYVVYNGNFYRFTAAHSAGPWSGSDAVAVNVGNELESKTDTDDLKEMAYIDDAASDGKVWTRKDGVWYDADGRYYTESEIDTKLNLKANLASPTFTGTPKAPTAAASTNNTQIATTAFVQTGLSGKSDNGHDHDTRYYTESEIDTKLGAKQDNLTFDSTPTASSTNPVTSGGVKSALDLKAPLASPTLTGTPKAPTAAAGTSTTQIATTAFVAAGLDGKLDLHGTADLSGAVAPIQLTNEDLNDLIPNNTTWYYAGGTNTVTNRPPNSGSAFSLMVVRTAGQSKNQIYINSANGYIYSRNYFSSRWTAWTQWPVNFMTAGYRNSIYRGLDLGNEVTAEQYAAISSGTFENLFIGDYWVIDNINWRIAAFDYWLGTGDTECTTHHVVIVPDSSLANAKMNATTTTTGAYVGSDFYTGNNDNTAKATANAAIESAFGAAHILTHREYLQNAVTDGYESSSAYYDSTWELMSETMVYGCNIYKSTLRGTNLPSVGNVNKSQLPLFRLDPSKISAPRIYIWLRDVISGTGFAMVHPHGQSSYHNASNTDRVRPAFGICA